MSEPKCVYESASDTMFVRVRETTPSTSRYLPEGVWIVSDRQGRLVSVEIYCADLLNQQFAEPATRPLPPHPPLNSREPFQLDSAGREGEGEVVTLGDPPQPPPTLDEGKLGGKSATTARQKPGCRLPQEWWYDNDLAAWAAENIERVDLDFETEKFRDFWHGKSGKDATKVDWRATWRNWMRTAAGGRPRGRPTAGADGPDERVAQIQQLKKLFREET